MFEKTEAQHDQGNASIASAHVFESAYGLTARDTSRTDASRMVAQNEYQPTGQRSGSDAWPPPLSVADSNGNILTNGSDKSKTSGKEQASTETAGDKPPADGAKPEDLKTGEKGATAKAGDKTEKPADPGNLRPDLAREAELMKDVSGPQKDILNLAFNSVGQKLWARSRFASETANGAYGCASAESVLKQKAGYDYADSPLVSGLMNQLMKHGWSKHPFDERQPGDTVVKHKPGKSWMNGGGKAHIGTVGADTNFAYSNDSATGAWKYEPIDKAFSPNNKRFVLRPPEEGTLVAKGR